MALICSTAGAQPLPASSGGAAVMDDVVDVHVHVQLDGWSPMAAKMHDLPTYLAQPAAGRVKHIGVLAMAPLEDLERTRRQNDDVLDVSRSAPGAYAMCSVHPLDGASALDELTRVAAEGARGIKLHPNTQGFDVGDPAVLGVVQRAGELGLPVLFDSIAVNDPGQPEKFMMLAVQSPDTQLVLAHAFGPKFASAVMFSVLGRYPAYTRNVWLEVSALCCMFAGSPFAEQIAWVLRTHGLDRVLWGSDYPLYSLEEALAAVESYAFDASERQRLMHDNAVELFGLDS